MELINTQKGKLLEQMKQAMLAHIPIIYVPTDQIEIIQEVLLGQDTSNSLLPRVVYSIENDGVKLLTDELYNDNGNSYIDNYIINNIEFKNSIPSIGVFYVDAWDNCIDKITTFLQTSLGIKSGKGYRKKDEIETARRSVCIVVMPQEKPAPLSIAPYIKTVRVPALSDEEIENIILDKLRDEKIPKKIIDTHLLNQMITSFRGFSRNKILQLLSLMIAEECIDFDNVKSNKVMNIIRSAKKQMLDNSQGLKWEKSTVSGVAGLDSITRWLNARKAIFEDPELARRQHMDIPNGVLISGIPGSGKSLMAKTASTILNMPLISLDMGALLGGIMGESEHNMINALAMAEQMAPCVLWIDEIEKAFSGSSQGASSSDGGVGRRMFGKFLTWMQEKSAACFVFATSNDISCLPPELFRSERFDRKFFTFMPTATECAKIFAANIKSQNSAYQKELVGMRPSLRRLQAQNLFDLELENEAFWLNIINECCTNDIASCNLKNINEGKIDNNEKDLPPVYSWSTISKPKNKLMTGADISALIKEAKFRVCPAPTKNNSTVIYNAENMGNAVQNILRGSDYKPYGETNLKDIVKCFLKLHENEFVPAAGNCILDFNCYDTDKHIYIHDPASASKWKHNYDKVLYYTVVGAINHYSKELDRS